MKYQIDDIVVIKDFPDKCFRVLGYMQDVNLGVIKIPKTVVLIQMTQNKAENVIAEVAEDKIVRKDILGSKLWKILS